MPMVFVISILLIKVLLRVFPNIKSTSLMNHQVNLDGFRGILAFLVCIHHSVIAYRYYNIDGKWVLPDSQFYTLIGQFAVSGFFCLTGFLFWSKLLSGDMFDVVKFFRGRIRRIIPAYIFSVLLLMLLVFIESGLKVVAPLDELVRQIFTWFLLGVNGAPDVNGVINTGVINAYVFWTLKYEFYFYLSLPLLSLFIKPVHFTLIALSIIFYYTWYLPDKEYVVIYFIVGAICSYANKVKEIEPFVKGRKATAFLLLACFGFFFICHTAYDWFGILMSIPIMFMVLNGNDIFGLLKTQSLKFLGTISYSLYLLHGIVIYCVHSIFGISLDLFVFVTIVMVIAILISAVSYFKIEHPFIRV